MPNMSYCRFENTNRAFGYCADHVRDELKGSEAAARRILVDNARALLRDIGDRVDENPTWESDLGDESDDD